MQDIAYIPLRGRDKQVRAYTLVDVELFAELNQWRWCLLSNGYVQRGSVHDGKPFVVLMHRQILKLGLGDARQGDHINLDKLDNRRSNLRIVTNRQNGQNRRGTGRGSSTYRGVVLRPSGNWSAGIKIDGINHHVGTFSTEREAADAAAAYRREHMPFSTN